MQITARLARAAFGLGSVYKILLTAALICELGRNKLRNFKSESAVQNNKVVYA